MLILQTPVAVQAPPPTRIAVARPAASPRYATNRGLRSTPHRRARLSLAPSLSIKEDGETKPRAQPGEEVKLLGSWSSPYVVRVRVALNLKGVDYEFLPQAFGNKWEMVALHNPAFKKIPVLLHNGRAISESMIIVNYIDDAWPSSGPALLPSSPFDRALARFWTVYFDDKWFAALKAAAILAESEESKAAAAAVVVEGLQRLERAFEECSKGEEYFGGDSMGYLDIAVGSHLGWLKAAEEMNDVDYLNEETMPKLAAWAERFVAHPAAAGLVPEPERLIEFAHQLQAKQKALAKI